MFPLWTNELFIQKIFIGAYKSPEYILINKVRAVKKVEYLNSWNLYPIPILKLKIYQVISIVIFTVIYTHTHMHVYVI